MATVTRAMLRQATIEEFGEDARLLHAIDTVSITEVLGVTSLEDIDEATCDDATLVALAVDYHYGTGWEFGA